MPNNVNRLCIKRDNVAILTGNYFDVKIQITMILTEKRVRQIVREETADIRVNMLTKDDAKLFLTKDDAMQFLTKDDAKRFATKDDLKRFATKDDLKRFLTKEDAKDFLRKKDAETISMRTANLVMEKMQDQFRIFGEKLGFVDDRRSSNKIDITENRERIDLNSMKILQVRANQTNI